MRFCKLVKALIHVGISKAIRRRVVSKKMESYTESFFCFSFYGACNGFQAKVSLFCHLDYIFFFRLGLGIMPGTNWCGRGFQANGYRDLGSYGGADKCCRQHDLGCPAWIPSGQTRYGLYNYKYYTMNHCTCDER